MYPNVLEALPTIFATVAAVQKEAVEFNKQQAIDTIEYLYNLSNPTTAFENIKAHVEGLVDVMSKHKP